MCDQQCGEVRIRVAGGWLLWISLITTLGSKPDCSREPSPTLAWVSEHFVRSSFDLDSEFGV